MDVAKGRFAYRDAESRGGRLADCVHFHVEAGEEAAGDVEGGVAVGLVALDAGADATLLAYSAAQLPPRRRDVVDAVDGLEKDRVGEPHLRYPEAADDVGPA